MRLSRGKNGSREAYIWEKGLFCLALGMCLVYTGPGLSPQQQTHKIILRYPLYNCLCLDKQDWVKVLVVKSGVQILSTHRRGGHGHTCSPMRKWVGSRSFTVSQPPWTVSFKLNERHSASQNWGAKQTEMASPDTFLWPPRECAWAHLRCTFGSLFFKKMLMWAFWWKLHLSDFYPDSCIWLQSRSEIQSS